MKERFVFSSLGAISQLWDMRGSCDLLTLHRDDGSQRPSMFKKAMVAPRGQARARNDPGRSPHDPVGPRPYPRALFRPPISFESRTRGWLHEAIYVHERHGGAQRPGDSQRRSGEVPPRPCWAQALAPGPVSSCNLI